MHQTVAFSKHYTTHLLICSSVTRTPTLIIRCFFSSGTSVSAFIAFNTWQLFQEWNIGSAKYTPILPVYHLDIFYASIYIYISILCIPKVCRSRIVPSDGLAISISSVAGVQIVVLKLAQRKRQIIQSSPFISLPLTLFFKDHTGKTKKRFTKLQTLVNHL